MNDYKKSYRYAVQHLAAVAVMRARAGEFPIDYSRLEIDVNIEAESMVNAQFMPSTGVTCDDALDALNMLIKYGVTTTGAEVVGAIPTIRNFLTGLVKLSEPDGIIETDEQGYIIEGALQSGFETIDNNGDLLVVHANDLIKYVTQQRVPHWISTKRHMPQPGLVVNAISDGTIHAGRIFTEGGGRPADWFIQLPELPEEEE